MSEPQIQQSRSLTPYTSFQVGGPAEELIEVSNADELQTALANHKAGPLWLLGYGSNTLISDAGLPGLTVIMHGGQMSFNGEQVVVDAGVWWDDIVNASIERGLWGLELMSEIPGSVGAALFINITAYGQSVGPLVEWVEVWDADLKQVRRIGKEELRWSYKQSIFQRDENRKLVILRACLRLSNKKTNELTYQKALDVAKELKLDMDFLSDRRQIIVEARRRAGSLWQPGDSDVYRTAGSFFRNPVVSEEQAEHVFDYEEFGKTKDQIAQQNIVHAGSKQRVSAAHVMLAAGFKRGQSWGNVKLSDQNVLKIETLPGATAQDVYNVMRTIQQTVRQTLAIELEPEVRILGEFDD